MLPPQLKELQIQFDTSYTIPEDQLHAQRIARMQALVKNKEMYLPQLERVVFWYAYSRISCFYWYEYELMDLGSPLKKVGVKFEFSWGLSFKDTLLGRPRYA